MRLRSIAVLLLLIPVAAITLLALQPIKATLPPRPAPVEPLRASLAIAPLDEALTFARSSDRSGTSTLAVRRYQDGTVFGVDLTPLMQPGEDAVALYNRLGYDAVAAFIGASGKGATRDAATLTVPVDLRRVHAAAATNYPEHADEAKVEDGPFLFAKVAQPTGPRAPLPASQGLLDYEVELCLVTLSPLTTSDRARGGLMLCNDLTDRAALMRGADVSDITSGKGFTDGKSGRGFLPVGDLLVIPRDLKAFVKPIELNLSVNGQARQKTRVTQWIWDLDRLLIETDRRKDTVWTWREGQARLPVSAQGVIPDRTLILAGTPAGTVFKGPGPSTFVRGALDWVAGFGKRSLVQAIVERTIADDRATNAYLQPGDVVTIRVDRMGTLENRVELQDAP
jgi:2-keto-4-pentenoate hydratase/2-oxohepta-3-ene-1,7-dioic acid hydratase in catechol pathway